MGGRGKQLGYLAEFGAGVAHSGGYGVEALSRVGGGLGRGGLRAAAAMSLALLKHLAGAGKCVAFSVHEALDFQRQFYIAAAVEALASAALVGFELRELRLPKSQNVGFHLADASHVSDLEVETVRDRGCFNSAFAGKLCSHSGGEAAAARRPEATL